MSTVMYSPAGFKRPTTLRRRRGLGVITGPNPANLTQDQLAALLPEQLQEYQSVGFYYPTLAQDAAAAANPTSYAQVATAVGQNAAPPAAATPIAAPAAMQRGVSTVQPSGPNITPVLPPVQTCPAWGCGPNLPIISSIPWVPPASTQGPVSSSPVSFLSITFLGFPLWLWGVGAVGAYFLFFQGGGHGR